MSNIITHQGNANYNQRGIRMAKIKNNDNTKWWWGCGETESLIYWWWKFTVVQPRWKTVWQFLIKLNMQLPQNRVTALPGIYSREMKTCSYENCTKIFIYLGLFGTAQNWTQSRYPLTGELFKKLCISRPLNTN